MMFGKYKQLSKDAILAIRGDLPRFFFLVFIMMIAFAALTASLSILDGFRSQAQSLVKDWGFRRCTIGAWPRMYEPWTRDVTVKALNTRDIEHLNHVFCNEAIFYPGVPPVARDVRMGSNRASCDVILMDQNRWKVEGCVITSGEAFSDTDLLSSSAVCLIGQSVRKDLCGRDSPIGMWLSLEGIPVQIKGVLKKKGYDWANNDLDRAIWVPFEFGWRRLLSERERNIFRIAFVVNDGKAIPDVCARVAGELRAMKIPPHLRGGYHITSPITIASRYKAATWPTIVTSFLVAFISIVLACSVLSNVLFLSVKQREGEFALRRALGATKTSVVYSLYCEVGIIVLVGSLLGFTGALIASCYIPSLRPVPGTTFSLLPMKVGMKLAPLIMMICGVVAFISTRTAAHYVCNVDPRSAMDCAK